jgi:hypothetical protein
MRRASAHRAWGSRHDTAEPVRRNRRDLFAERHDQPDTARGLAPLSRLAARTFAADEGGCVLRRFAYRLDRHLAAFRSASGDFGALGPQPARGDGCLVRHGAFADIAGFGLSGASLDGGVLSGAVGFAGMAIVLIVLSLP